MDLLYSLPAYNFLGLEEKHSNFEKSKIAVLQIPFDSTTSWKPGTRFGPKAIIEASRYIELYDHEIDFEAYKEGIFTFNELEPSRGNCDETMQRIEESASDILSKKKFLVSLGGDHSVSIGLLNAFAEHFKDFSILHFDAHQDLREEYEGSKNSHACAMARGFEKAKSMVQVGIRSTEKEELEFAKRNGIKVVFAEEFNEKPLEKIIKEIMPNLKQKVYISIDVDALDPSEMPSTGTPEPNGLKYHQILKIIRKVAEEKEIIGLDVVELMPIDGLHAPNFLAAKMIYKILGYKFKYQK